MRICILASESSKKEILQKGIPSGLAIIWKTNIHELKPGEADVYMDLLFENMVERVAVLKTLFPATIFINSVSDTTSETDLSFIRINAWPGFLQRNICEVASGKENRKEDIAAIMASLGWDHKIVPDQPGMIAPRVIAMIINEAYFALGEQVSTKAEIDIAMKLGTNYPLGPFEWAEKIGLDNIKSLLDHMSRSDERYTVAEALKNEVLSLNV